MPVAPPVPTGLDLAPFRALRYAGLPLADVTSPPYDVVDEAARTALEARDPHNAVRLVLPRADDGPGSGYAAAARRLRAWRDAGVLALDERPALYVYETVDQGHVQRGLVGELALAPFDAGVVLPHEDTMAGPVADRLALMEATGADLEPIVLVHRGEPGDAVAHAVEAAGTRAPLAGFTDDAGVRHALWALDADAVAPVRAALAERRATIADGHHRYTTYLQRQAAAWAAGRGPGPWDRGLVLLLDTASFGPRVLPIHRVLPGLAWAEAVRRAGAGFHVEQVSGGADALLEALDRMGGTAFALGDGHGRGALLHGADPRQVSAAMPADRSAAWQGLDVSIAHRFLIGALWGVEDTESAVGFEHDAPAALDRAAATGGTALLLRATPVDAVGEVAAAGDRMPRKSTLFVPKPRTGVVLRLLDPARSG